MAIQGPDLATTRRTHRRAVRLQIILPIIVAMLVVFVVVPLLLAAGFSGGQVNTTASFAAALLMFPVVLLCFVPYALLLMGVLGMVGVNRRMPRYLHSGRRIAHSLNTGSKRLSVTVSRPVIAASKRLAWLERLFGAEPPSAR